jgi:hypothetical protein
VLLPRLPWTSSEFSCPWAQQYARGGQPPTFTEVFQALEAQTQSMSEAEVAAAEDLPLDDIQWTKLAEAGREAEVGASATRSWGPLDLSSSAGAFN